MNSISNDFVTIEYDDFQKEKAEYYIKLFNEEPEFYKGLLNGKTSINSGELSRVTYFCIEEDNEDIKTINKELLNKGIMGMNGVTDKMYPFEDRNNTTIYDCIMDYIYGNPSVMRIDEIVTSLIYDYFKKTKDFEYIKNYLYGDGITNEDIMEICAYNIMEHYDELLREKVHKDVSTLSTDESITKNFNAIMSILVNVAGLINSKYNYKKLSQEEIYRKLQNNPIPKLDNKKFEVLVKEVLEYIDPTNELLDEYLKCRSENRIEEEMVVAGNESSYFWKNEDGYGIKLYKRGNITDVIVLCHELGHLHYVNKNEKAGNSLFDEYPSIYYELKAAEYLSTIYSEEDVHFATLFRAADNMTNLTFLVPVIHSVHINMDKTKEDYDLEPIKKILSLYDQQMDISPLQNILSQEQIEQLKQQQEAQIMRMKWLMLKQETKLVSTLKYMVGTFLADDAINNLEHEEILKMLDTITSEEYSLYDVLIMQGLLPAPNKQEKPKAKAKTDDINNQ